MVWASITEPADRAAAGPAGAAPSAHEDRLRAHQERQRRGEAMLRLVVPVVIVALLLLLWEWLGRANRIPHYILPPPSLILPAPSLILRTLFEHWDSLSSALWFTVRLTLLALAAAIVGGVLLAIAFA